MITFSQLKDLLSNDLSITIKMPTGKTVPEHFHITEVGLVRKNFIDCGGTRRETLACVLQVWVADDADHRLSSTKLKKILGVATPLFGDDDPPVEIEYEGESFSQYPLVDVMKPLGGKQVTFVLGNKHTACLAPDKCGVSKCSGSGCC